MEPPAKKAKQQSLLSFILPTSSSSASTCVTSSSTASTTPAAIIPQAPNVATNSVTTVPKTDNLDAKRGRSFKAEWHTTFPWLTYNSAEGKAYCMTCKNAYDQHLLDHFSTMKLAFIINGFSDWQHAISRFKGHEKSDCHRCSAEKLATMQAGVNVVSSMSKEKQTQMEEARNALSSIVSSIVYLAQQGLAIRGKTDEHANFNQLLILRARDSPLLHSWLSREKSYKWISHDIQNEILKLISDKVLRSVLDQIRSCVYYSLILDETTDCSRHEQLSVCLRYCDVSLDIYEMFLGFYEIHQQDAQTLHKTTMDILLRFNLRVEDCRGLCFDGGANFSGRNTGLQKLIREQEPRALYVHCASHSINLVVQDSIAASKTYRDTMSLLANLISFVRESPKRLRLFEKVQDEAHNNLRPFCPTRWILRESAINSVMNNYSSLLEFLNELSDNDRSDIGSKADGFAKQLSKFHTFFNIFTLLKVFQLIGTVNQAMQSSTLQLYVANEMLQHLLSTLKSYRSDFSSTWQACTEKAAELNLTSPVIPRCTKTPRRYDSGSTDYTFSSTEEYFRQTYFALIDYAISGIESRFSSDTWSQLTSFEKAMTATPLQPDIITNFYKDDLNAERFKLHLQMFHDITSQKGVNISSLSDIVDYLRTDKPLSALLTELVKGVMLLLTVPVTSCTAERSFSGLRRLKTYIRSTMSQTRLNHVAVLNCHKQMLQTVDKEELMNEFIDKSTVRRNTFAKK